MPAVMKEEELENARLLAAAAEDRLLQEMKDYDHATAHFQDTAPHPLKGCQQKVNLSHERNVKLCSVGESLVGAQVNTCSVKQIDATFSGDAETPPGADSY